ncbi:hypothetical protein Tco_0952110 [Tanacetum coccineum]|uniref:Uncharacterized protein n=1 Tax=Tanacetum coccineum TaxID=301880 RepID=A0ABQ5DW58_9ASTR
MSTSSSTPAISSDVAELKDMVRALILDRKNQTPSSAPVKAVEQSCVTCGGDTRRGQEKILNDYVTANDAVLRKWQTKVSLPEVVLHPRRKQLILDIEGDKGHDASDNNGSTEDVQLLLFKSNLLDRCLDAHAVFASTLKTLIGNKEKLSEIARTPLNEKMFMRSSHQVTKKLGDPGPISDSIFALPELNPNLHEVRASRSPPVLFDSRAMFLKNIVHALIDVYGGRDYLRVGKEAISIQLGQTQNTQLITGNILTANKIVVIDWLVMSISQMGLGFSNVIESGNPLRILSLLFYNVLQSQSFGDSDFPLNGRRDSFLALEDDQTSSEVDPTFRIQRGTLILEAFDSEHHPHLPNHGPIYAWW